MLKKTLILISSLYLICLTGPTVLNYLPRYDQLARVCACRKSLEGLPAGDHTLVFSLGYLVYLIFLGLSLGKEAKRSMTLTSLALANLVLRLPLLCEATQVLISQAL